MQFAAKTLHATWPASFPGQSLSCDGTEYIENQLIFVDDYYNTDDVGFQVKPCCQDVRASIVEMIFRRELFKHRLQRWRKDLQHCVVTYQNAVENNELRASLISCTKCCKQCGTSPVPWCGCIWTCFNTPYIGC